MMIKGLNGDQHRLLTKIAVANSAGQGGEHEPFLPQDQMDLFLAKELFDVGYVKAVVPPGSTNPLYPLLDLQHGVHITTEGLAVLPCPFVVGTIGVRVDGFGGGSEYPASFSGSLAGLTDTLYGWSDGVVTWTMDRTFS